MTSTSLFVSVKHFSCPLPLQVNLLSILSGCFSNFLFSTGSWVSTPACESFVGPFDVSPVGFLSQMFWGLVSPVQPRGLGARCLEKGLPNEILHYCVLHLPGSFFLLLLFFMRACVCFSYHLHVVFLSFVIERNSFSNIQIIFRGKWSTNLDLPFVVFHSHSVLDMVSKVC